MKLYVTRHGETDLNTKGIYNGRHDEDINENGINQAKELGEKLNNVKFDIIISSPMIRAKHTADIINANNTVVINDDRLIERDYGIYTLKPYLSLVNREKFWNIFLNESYENAESIIDMYSRVVSFIEDIKTKYKKNIVLIVTHSGVARLISAYFEGMPDDGILTKYFLGNCEVNTYEIN